MHLERLWRLAWCLALLIGCGRHRVYPVALPRADITVALDTTGTCRTINEALGRAREGNVILVMPGVYREHVKLTDIGHVTLVGLNPATTVVDASGCYAAVEIRTDSNRVSGFTLRNADSHGVWVRDGHQVIERCLVTDNGERGIYLSALTGNASARIQHCTVADNAETGIHAARDSSGVIISDCILAFNARGVVTDHSTGRMTVKRNCVYNRLLDFDQVLPGDSNIVADPRFASRERGDYRLTRASPCLGAGAGRTNLGCF